MKVKDMKLNNQLVIHAKPGSSDDAFFLVTFISLQ